MADSETLARALAALPESERDDFIAEFARLREKIPGLDVTTFLAARRAKRAAETWEASLVPPLRLGPGRRTNSGDFAAIPQDKFIEKHCEARRYHFAAHPRERYTRAVLASHVCVSEATIKAYLARHRLRWPLCPCPQGVCAMTVKLTPDEEPSSVIVGNAKTLREEAERLRWAGLQRRLKKIAAR